MPQIYSSLFSDKKTVEILLMLVIATNLLFYSNDYNTNYAYGHANPVSYLPSANSVINSGQDESLPDNVSILFSERPEPKVSYIHVTNSKNERVDNNDFKIIGQNDREASVTLDKNKIIDGVYSVSWLVLSRDDGHISKGSYVFRVQSPQEQQSQQMGASAQRANIKNNSLVEQATVDNVNITLKVTPFYLGENSFNVTFTEKSGEFSSNINNVILAFTNPQAGLGPIVATLNKTGEGKFAAQGSYLSQLGNWEIRITAQRSGGYDLNHTFDAVVEEAPAANITSSP
ncbi:MAG: copper resistance protein CopC [Nitrososphaeraceae archaeon]|jgi:methionine-rich copper-binding protein CopC